MGVYGLWTLFALPGFRKVPTCLKVLQVIYHILAAIYSICSVIHNKELPIALYSISTLGDIFLDGNTLYSCCLDWREERENQSN